MTHNFASSLDFSEWCEYSTLKKTKSAINGRVELESPANFQFHALK